MAASLNASAENGGFLFLTFRGEQSPMTEQIYFGLSQNGREWSALNGGKPVLISELGEKGVRDPYLLRAEDNQGFYLIATDLSINLNRDWKRAKQKGSHSIVVWESSDLVQWSKPRLVRVAPEDAGCTWAPEAIYDPESRRYLVYWASSNQRDNFEKHRIWGAWTTDFHTFSEPFIYIEKPVSIIDTDVVHGDDGKFYRFTKNERDTAISMETCDSVTGQWTEVPGFSLAQLHGYEGPECYRVAAPSSGKSAVWCLILDYYTKSKGYQPFVTNDLAGGQFIPGEGFHFPFPFRHGSVLALSEEEYLRVKRAYPEKK